MRARDIYMPHLVRVIVARSASAFNEPRLIGASKERDERRLHSTPRFARSFLQKNSSTRANRMAYRRHRVPGRIAVRVHTHARTHAVCTAARASAVSTYDETVMYKVLQVNGQQTGREPRINERNFGTCGMPADAPWFICIQACSFVHASSAATFTRVPFLFSSCEKRRRERIDRKRKSEKEKEWGREEVETGTQDMSSTLSSAAR